MPEIQFPTADGARITLLQRLGQRFAATPPDELPVPAKTATAVQTMLVKWQPLVAAGRLATSGQSGDVTKLHGAQTKAAMYVSHYLQVFNFAVRREVYPTADRALFGLPIASADLPDFKTVAGLQTWLTNVATGDAALQAAGRPEMTNPTAAEVAAQALAFTTLLQTRDASGQTKSAAADAVEHLRPEVDELIEDVYADLKNTYRKLPAPKWRELARTYGFRFTNHRGEHPEGRYADALAAGELREVYEGVFSADLRLRLRNTGLTAWEIGLAPTADGLPAGQTLIVGAGQEVRCGLSELGNISFRHLLIRSLDKNQTGAYEIEFETHG